MQLFQPSLRAKLSRQMNPPQLEQMVSSSSSWIAHKTGSISEKKHSRSDHFVRRNYDRMKKQTDIPVLHSDREVPGTLLVRFW
jgi:uncharacterized membrane protein